MAKKIEKLKMSALCDLYGSLLTEKQQQMLRLFYDYDNSLAEIAEQFGISRQGVHDCIAKAEEQLLALEDKLSLYAKVNKINQLISSVNSQLTNQQTEITTQLGEISRILYGE